MNKNKYDPKKIVLTFAGREIKGYAETTVKSKWGLRARIRAKCCAFNQRAKWFWLRFRLIFCKAYIGYDPGYSGDGIHWVKLKVLDGKFYEIASGVSCKIK